MKLKLLFLFGMAFLIGGCQLLGSGKKQATIYSAELYSAYSAVPQSLSIGRSDLIFKSGEVATDCNSYYQLSLAGRVDESVSNQQVRGEYLVCDALKILENTTLSAVDSVDVTFGQALRSGLDLRSFPSSVRQLAEETKYSFEELFPAESDVLAETVRLSLEDWNLSVSVVATLDLNASGNADWVIWVVDESLDGNYRSYGTYVIYDPDMNKPYQAELYDK